MRQPPHCSQGLAVGTGEWGEGGAGSCRGGVLGRPRQGTGKARAWRSELGPLVPWLSCWKIVPERCGWGHMFSKVISRLWRSVCSFLGGGCSFELDSFSVRKTSCAVGSQGRAWAGTGCFAASNRMCAGRCPEPESAYKKSRFLCTSLRRKDPARPRSSCARGGRPQAAGLALVGHSHSQRDCGERADPVAWREGTGVGKRGAFRGQCGAFSLGQLLEQLGQLRGVRWPPGPFPAGLQL